MSIISVLIALVVIGVILWLVNTYIPMDGKIKKILNVAVVVLTVVWLLYVFTGIGPGDGMNVGNMRMR